MTEGQAAEIQLPRRGGGNSYYPGGALTRGEGSSLFFSSFPRKRQGMFKT